VAVELVALGYSGVAWEPDGVTVHTCGTDQEYIGLVNVYRRAAAIDQAEWPGIIREFLTHRAAFLKAPALPDDLTTISDRLRPRLGRPCDRTDKTPPWGIPLPGTGLEINLVVDFPHGMVYVTGAMLSRSRKNGEDLLDVALENLRAATPSDYFERASEELEVYIGHLGDGYDSARALLIEELMADAPAGYWVAIPSREELAVWPVSFPALSRVHSLKMYAQENYKKHAYAVSEAVYWVWHGTWYEFGIALGDEVLLDAPEPFGEALQELGDR
jgi:hypothetical protein